MIQSEVVVKSFMCMLRTIKGNVVKVSFGDTTGLSIKRDDPERENRSEQDTIVTIQVQSGKQDIGLVISGVQEQR